MRSLAAAVLAVLLACGCVSSAPDVVFERAERYGEIRDLPAPQLAGPMSVEQALNERRSTREWSAIEPELAVLSQLLWAAQGVTDPSGRRSAPSAGARYPLELYVVTSEEIMHYLPARHGVEIAPASGVRSKLAAAAFGQEWIKTAPAVFVITGTVATTAQEYGAVASRLMDREAGHAAQNILLAATGLGLAGVPVGGFEPHEVSRLLLLSPAEEVLYLVPVGYPEAVG